VHCTTLLGLGFRRVQTLASALCAAPPTIVMSEFSNEVWDWGTWGCGLCLGVVFDVAEFWGMDWGLGLSEFEGNLANRMLSGQCYFSQYSRW